MKFWKVISFSLIFFTTLTVMGQSISLPAVSVKTLQFEDVNFAEINNNGKPILIHFWASWCTHCHSQLDNIAEIYDVWEKETCVKVIAIAMDDSRSMYKVPAFVRFKNWNYDVYIDPNGDLKRAMGVNTMPHTFILNGQGEIVWEAVSYANGDEDIMFEVLKEL